MKVPHKNQNQVFLKLIEILGTISKESTLALSNKENAVVTLKDNRTLMTISHTNIVIAGVALSNNLFNQPSNLNDEFVPLQEIKDFFSYLFSNNFYKRLNHVGFCYHVDSISDEKERLIREAKKANFHLYEETSNVPHHSWLFLGNTKDWRNPLVEFILIEETDDKWKDYWLPHIQIDIDTVLSDDEIMELVLKTIKGTIKPFPLFKTEEFTVITRVRLGVISGININLDVGFEGRMARYHRVKMLTKLV